MITSALYSLLDKVQSAISAQSSYDEPHHNPTLGTDYDPPYHAIYFSGVDGDVEIVDGEGNTVTLPQGLLAAEVFYPITIQEVTGNTTMTTSNILLLRE